MPLTPSFDPDLAAQIAETSNLAQRLGHAPAIDAECWEVVRALWAAVRAHKPTTTEAEMARMVTQAAGMVLTACAGVDERPRLMAGAAAHLVQLGAQARKHRRAPG